MKNVVYLFLVVSLAFSKDLPTQFDLRDYDGENYISSVKNQQGGTCWTHAVMAAMESNIMRTDPNYLNNEPNFSEYHLDWWNGFNQFQNLDADPITGNGLEVHQGGDYLVASAYLTRCDGIVMGEGAHSYNTAPDFESSSYTWFTSDDVEWYTMDSELNGIDEIKECLMSNGAIGTCMAYSSSFIDYSYNHYQPVSSDMLPNHAVTIVGWDDDRVISGAPGNGAWIVKNSWGEYWGDDGYFYISYYDKWSCKEEFMGAVSFRNTHQLQPEDREINFYDYHGWRDTAVEIDEAFNHFPLDLSNSSAISAISFFTPVDNCEFNLKLYSGFSNGELSGLLYETSGTYEKRGYHKLTNLYVDGPLNEVYLYLQFDDGGHPFDRTSDVPVLLGGTPSKTIVTSKAEPGQSYYKDGDEWKDFYDYDLGEFSQTGNFCMKVYTVTMPSVGEDVISSSSILKNYPNPFNPTTTLSFDLSFSSDIQIDIYELSGAIVKSYNLGEMEAGVHTLEFDGSNLSSGTYIAKMMTNGVVASTSKMILLK